MSHKKAKLFFKKDKHFKNIDVPKIPERNKRNHFDTLVTSIVYQQISGKAASSIYSRLKAYCKGRITPEKISKTRPAQLKKLGLSPQKTSYIKDLSKKFLNKEVNTRKFPSLTNDEVIEELTKIKGIGVWTAQMFLIFHLGREDVFPVADLGVQKAFTKLFSVSDVSQMESISKKWEPYRTYASLMLWKTIDTVNPDGESDW
ncbi:DNA-3-methyladenine glycosylase family protein [Candidatus Aenigmatarchaeota archaeon]